MLKKASTALGRSGSVVKIEEDSWFHPLLRLLKLFSWLLVFVLQHRRRQGSHLGDDSVNYGWPETKWLWFLCSVQTPKSLWRLPSKWGYFWCREEDFCAKWERSGLNHPTATAPQGTSLEPLACSKPGPSSPTPLSQPDTSPTDSRSLLVLFGSMKFL